MLPNDTIMLEAKALKVTVVVDPQAVAGSIDPAETIGKAQIEARIAIEGQPTLRTRFNSKSLRRALEEFAVVGIKTTIPLHQRIVDAPDFQAGDYTIHWLEKFVAGH